MSKIKNPLLSLGAIGKLGADLVYTIRHKNPIAQKRAQPQDAKSITQLSWRHMFQKVVALWHALSAAEKEQWEALARPKHMTGYAWFVSQALRPNPGIYLPLQGGIMQGIIDMDGYAIQNLLDPVNPQDADTEAARDAAIADALEDCIDSHIHGWDGSNWQKLLVESATYHNLRVAIWEDNKPAHIDRLTEVNLADTRYALDTNAALRISNPANTRWDEVQDAVSLGDGSTGIYFFPVGLMGYNGATWDRLRSYGTGILKIGRAEIGLSTPRLIAAGQVKAAPGNLYWMNLNPSAGNSAVELSDDLDGSTAIVLDHFDTNRDGHMITFDPPMEFSTGIYLKTFTNMTSVTFGYK